MTAFTSATAFEVNGIPVDATGATVDNGPVVLGARVEVRGSSVNGTIVATRVKVLRADDDAVRGVELHGTLSELDTTGKTFMLRGVKVAYGDLTVFQRGTVAQLANGVSVEVKGALSADGQTLAAIVVEFED